jgi:hypothetical protein
MYALCHFVRVILKERETETAGEGDVSRYILNETPSQAEIRNLEN